jgi:hypothetical protein
MKLDHYEFVYDEVCLNFEFISEGPKGRIVKEIQYSKTIYKGVYNLAFGDKNIINEDFDDTVTTDNKDAEKVLSTVAASVFIFTEKYPDLWVFITGSSKSRTRLYRMSISNNLNELENYFEIFGVFEGEIIRFEKNIVFEAFLIKKKK